MSTLISGCGFSVSGGGLGSVLRVSPGTVDFGTVSIGDLANTSIALVNDSPLPVDVLQIKVAGQTFSLGNSEKLPIRIPAGASHTLSLNFGPTTSNDFSGQLSVLGTTAKPMATVDIRGRGKGPISVNKSSLPFGNVALGTAVVQSVTLTSTSRSAFTLNSASTTGAGFSIVGGGLPMTLNPGQSTTLQVQFQPTAAGSVTGLMTVKTSATTGSLPVVSLSGTGVNGAVAQPDPQLTVSPSSLSFGSLTVNTAATKTITLTSSGSSALTVSAASISGSGFSIVSGSLPATLNPGQSTSLTVQFKPTTTGTLSGQLTISSDSTTGGTSVVALGGTGAAATSPQLTLSTSSLAFGSVTVNSAATKTVTLTSSGTSDVTVNAASITGAGYSIVSGSLPATLSPGQSTTLTVQFKPTTTGSLSGQLTVSSNSSTGSTSTVALSGTGTAALNPQLTVNPTSLSYGSVTVNTATTKTVTLTSSGTSDLIVNGASITGAGFSIVSGSLPATLSPGQSVSLTVQFKPTTTGTLSGQLTINCDSTTATVALSGTGTAAPSPQLTLSTGSLAFGSVTVNTATTNTVTLTSSGTSDLTVNSASITGAGFSILSGSLPATLSPGQSVSLTVQFKPTTTGSLSGQLTVSSNSSSGSTSTVALSGTSTAAANPQLTVNPTSLSYGSVTVNTPTTKTVTLTSSGTSDLTVNAASISGAGFSIVSGSLPATLSAGQSMALTVQFNPTTTGALSGQLTISSNSSTGSTSAVALSGTGAAAAAPKLGMSGSLSFGNVTVNTASTKTVTLTSSGTSDLTVNAASMTGSGFSIVAGSLPATLSPGQSMALTVQFKPTATGAQSGQLAVNSDSSTGSTSTMPSSGTGAAATNPQITVSPTSLSYGSVTVNTATTKTVTLTSSGTSDLTVNSASITGAGFTIVAGTLPATLSAGQSMSLTVQFKPTTTGTLSGQLTISSNSTTGSTSTVALSGTGAAAANPQITLNPTSLSFGNVTVNTPTTKTVTLTSSGTSDLTVNSASITGTGFSIVASSFPMTLTSGQSVTLQIQFNPTTAATDSGQLTISSNSTSGSTSVVALSGTGVAASNPKLSVSASSLDFGDVAVNTATTQTLTLSSTGTTAVTVNSTAITGTGFSVVAGTFPVTLNPGQTATVTVQYKPTTAATNSGQLTISSNSTTGSSTVVSLSGTGVTHEVDLSWIAPSGSSDPVVGYNIYRSTGGASFVVINSSQVSLLSYVDNAVVSGTSYTYVVKSIGSSGLESVASNPATATVP